MTRTERQARIRELSNLMTNLFYSDGRDEYERAYAEWEELTEQEDEAYKEEQLPSIKKYYTEHIQGKSWAEVEGDNWDFFSDWHKEVFGYRPRSTNLGYLEV